MICHRETWRQRGSETERRRFFASAVPRPRGGNNNSNSNSNNSNSNSHSTSHSTSNSRVGGLAASSLDSNSMTWRYFKLVNSSCGGIY